MTDITTTRKLASGSVACLDPTGRIVLEIISAERYEELVDEELEAAYWEDCCKAEAAAERAWEDRGWNDPEDPAERYAMAY